MCININLKLNYSQKLSTCLKKLKLSCALKSVFNLLIRFSLKFWFGVELWVGFWVVFRDCMKLGIEYLLGKIAFIFRLDRFWSNFGQRIFRIGIWRFLANLNCVNFSCAPGLCFCFLHSFWNCTLGMLLERILCSDLQGFPFFSFWHWIGGRHWICLLDLFSHLLSFCVCIDFYVFH